MPTKIRKLPGKNKYRVRNKGIITAYSTSKRNALRQKRLLNMLEYRKHKERQVRNMPTMKHKFANHHYRNMRKLEHNGDIGFGTGENIVTHVANMLDDRCHYKEINGKLYVRHLHIKHRVNGNGERRLVTDSKKFVPIEEHKTGQYKGIINLLEQTLTGGLSEKI